MKKSHRKIQLGIGEKFLKAVRKIDPDSISVNFFVDIRQYKTDVPSEITVFDERQSNFTICLYEDTDIKAIVHDLATKTYSELKEKYPRKWRTL